MGINRYIRRFAATIAMAAVVTAGGLRPVDPILAADQGIQTFDARPMVGNVPGWIFYDFWYSLTTDFYFDACENLSIRARAIWFENQNWANSYGFCGEVAAGPNNWGFGSITTTSLGNHWVEVCNYSTSVTMALRVEVAGPSGESTGQVLQYVDPPGGGCYKEIKGYPMRKWRVGAIYADGENDFSGWTALPA
jgi:hypothetical protein